MRLVLLAALIGGLGIGFGCSHEAKPVVAPDEHPPVPAASPLGYLVDDAAELKLRDDQIAKLRQIDDELGAKLATYESELRNGEPVPQGDPPPSRGGMNVGGGAGQTGHHGPELLRVRADLGYTYRQAGDRALRAWPPSHRGGVQP